MVEKFPSQPQPKGEGEKMVRREEQLLLKLDEPSDNKAPVKKAPEEQSDTLASRFDTGAVVPGEDEDDPYYDLRGTGHAPTNRME